MTQSRAASEPQSKAPASAKAGAGRFIWLRRIRGILLVSLSLSASAWIYRDGPPAGFSGGFGEGNCQACHFDYQVNTAPGSVRVTAPERYKPGETYRVTVTLTRPGMKVGGFQLTARFEDGGAQAGTLGIADADQDRIKVSTDRDIQYAYHKRPGTSLTGPHMVRWTLRWTAPEGGGSVIFNVAANAANEDDSQFGDYVFTASARSARSVRRP